MRCVSPTWLVEKIMSDDDLLNSAHKDLTKNASSGKNNQYNANPNHKPRTTPCLWAYNGPIIFVSSYISVLQTLRMVAWKLVIWRPWARCDSSHVGLTEHGHPQRAANHFGVNQTEGMSAFSFLTLIKPYICHFDLPHDLCRLLLALWSA